MHSKGVPQIGIESTIPRRQPHRHAAADADYHILPWLMVNQWSIRDTYLLFLRRLSKIAYRQSKKNPPEPNTT